MTTYLVFLRNQTNHQDFTVPVEAASSGVAVASVAERYPAPVYHTLTCFAAAELQAMLDDATRWPGVASTVQMPLEDLLRRVTAGTKLPPLPKGARAVDLEGDDVSAKAPLGARVQSVSGVVPGVMEREAKVAAAPTETPVYQGPQRRAAEPQPAMASFNAGRSVVDVLKALRG